MAVGENGSAAADPLAGERLRPCARAPPSSGFAVVLEPARSPPGRRGARLLSVPCTVKWRRGSEPHNGAGGGSQTR